MIPALIHILIVVIILGGRQSIYWHMGDSEKLDEVFLDLTTENAGELIQTTLGTEPIPIRRPK